jgi:subtilisin family serine protease
MRSSVIGIRRAPYILGAVLVCAVLNSLVPGPNAAAAAAADGADATPVPIGAPHGQLIPAGSSARSADQPPAANKFAGPVNGSVEGTHSVFVELAGGGAAAAANRALASGGPTVDGKVSATNRRAQVQQDADSLLTAARNVDPAAQELFQAANAVPGIGIRATKQALDALAASPDVVKISTLVPKTVSNAGAAQLTKVLDTWRSLGLSGDGVKIGVIDTGIDYTHADFGGPGTVDAWNAAHNDPTGPFTPTAKVVGGYDFVGEDYDAVPEDPSYQPIPHPDSNPIDCAGHGTHVAGTAAGLGVNADGTPFQGDYGSLTGDDLFGMKVAPGMAPKAALYALKIFGCAGGTDFTIPALDWALDPNGDGDFSDHLDIVNLSLGIDFAPVDDPENAVIDDLATHGVLAVAAMGNAGDLTDGGGSTGNAVRSLAVASSVDDYQLRDGLRINAPSEMAGLASGRVSVLYPWGTAPDVTGQVATLSEPGNLDGCQPLSTADTAGVAGKVAWVEWDENTTTRRCGSGAVAANIHAVGGIGALLTSTRVVFDATRIGGSPDIPLFQMSKADTERLRAPAEAGNLNLTFSGSLQAAVKDRSPSITDTLSGFSSRGPHGSLGVIKPDVAAPGDTIASAAMGTGTAPISFSGTSMASPHTAGIAALVKQVHPDWTPEQLKAAIINTAGNDIYTADNKTGNVFGPARVGAGRVDALAAVNTAILAYNDDGGGGVSASFGVVQAPVSTNRVTRTRTVRIQNTGRTAAELSLSYQDITEQPGVTYTVTPQTVTIQPNGTATATVSMTILPRQLRKTLDPTMKATQTNPQTGEDQARQYVSAASGHLLLQQTGLAVLRVPVYGAAKPASATTARDGRTRHGDPAIALSGAGFQQGTDSTAYESMLSIMDLGYQSPKEPTCTATTTTGCTFNPTTVAGDIRSVGAGATPNPHGSTANGWLWFGVSTFGDWATVGNSTQPYVQIDTTRDGNPDYVVTVQNEPNTDLLDAVLTDTQTGSVIDINPANFNDGAHDTNVFDTNVLLIPVNPAAIGLADGVSTFPITYSVGTFSEIFGTLANHDIDHTPSISFDVVNPAVRVADPLYYDNNNVRIPYTLGDRVRPDSGAQAVNQPADGQPDDQSLAALPENQATPAPTETSDIYGRHRHRATALIFHLHGYHDHRTEIAKLHG